MKNELQVKIDQKVGKIDFNYEEMKAELEKCGNITILDKTVSIKTRLSDASRLELQELANEISK